MELPHRGNSRVVGMHAAPEPNVVVFPVQLDLYPSPLNLLIPHVRQDMCERSPRWHRAPVHRHHAGQPGRVYQVRPDDLACVALDCRLYRIPVV